MSVADRAPGTASSARRIWRVQGQVQGVGFRPFVYRLACRHGLTGTVRNDPAGVTIEAQGAPSALQAFAAGLVDEAPDLATVDAVTLVCEADVVADETAFAIAPSDHAPAERGRVTVDAATCEACLEEILDAGDRRHGHALVNCTNCGPRYTIVRDLPYDRPLTTMAPFPMCPACEAEYGDPADRRFHAQPNCCPACGPQVRFVDAGGQALGDANDPVASAADALARGLVVAVKGLGGYHLAVDATNAEAVRRLREGKRRDHKPFAVMVADLEAARCLVALSDEAERALASPARPIVLAPRRPDARLAPDVAPESHRLGVMLAYTPIQHLLFARGLGPLVMTSANHSDDPLIEDDGLARDRLGSFCDAFLQHERAIERAVDDSIVLAAAHGLVPIRRARGYVPAPLRLPVEARPGLCVGGELKSVVAVVRGRDAFLSQHLGDLTWALALDRFRTTIDDLCRLFDVEPAWVACDAHPGYLSRQHGHALAEAWGVPVHEVQHHHAHLAALLAEHGRTEPVIGLVCDGVGYGADGQAWGGEVLLGDLGGYERLGRLRPLRLPGGDAAAKETGRCALSWLWDRFGEDALDHPLARVALPDGARRRGVASMLQQDVNAPPSSGLGRLFDAAASLLGVCDRNHHEAMSGMRLESAAARSSRRPAGDEAVTLTGSAQDPFELDTRPLLDALLSRIERGEAVEDTSWWFHDAIADGLARAAARAAAHTGLDTVALTGGVFCNELLTERVTGRLEGQGLGVLVHRRVPPNDGGIALGQAAVATARERLD